MKAGGFFSTNLPLLLAWSTAAQETFAEHVRSWLPRRRRDRSHVDDVSQELAAWLTGMRTNDRRRFDGICSWPEIEIQRYLAQQTRWIDVHGDQLSGPRHALGRMVGEVLSKGLPPGGDGFPDSLRKNGRFSKPQVQRAVAEIVDGEPGNWTRRGIVAALLGRYAFEIDPRAAAAVGGDNAENPEDAVRRARDGARLAERADARLDARQRRALALEEEHGEIAAVARGLGVARTRAYEILDSAKRTVRKAVESTRDGPGRELRFTSRPTRRAAVAALQRRLRGSR